MSFKKLLYIIFSCIGVAIVVISIIYPAKFQDTLSVWVKSAQEHALGREIISIPQSSTTGVLTDDGVFKETNKEREANNLPALTENSKLDAAAQAKVKDMFQQQYFEHVSPEGNGPGYLADQVGYSYLLIGENLALGNFKDNEALLAAWMASPGHRANILNNQFTDIGVAVGEGMYQGKETWLAVQEFGTPSSLCPNINQALKTKVDADKVQSDAMSKELDTMKQELTTMPRTTPSERANYNSNVDAYNVIVGQYTKLVASLRTEIDEYNTEVRNFNNCLNSHQSTSTVSE